MRYGWILWTLGGLGLTAACAARDATPVIGVTNCCFNGTEQNSACAASGNVCRADSSCLPDIGNPTNCMSDTDCVCGAHCLACAGSATKVCAVSCSVTVSAGTGPDTTTSTGSGCLDNGG